MGRLLDIAARCEKSEKSEISPPSAPTTDLNSLNSLNSQNRDSGASPRGARLADLFSLNSLNSHCNAENIPANDPGPVAPRWRIVHPDGRTFEVSCYPPATRVEVLTQEPMGTQAEPVSMSMGGNLPHEDVEIIKAVCSAWGATPDETRDAIAEASSNPALMDGWRGETEKLADSGLTELTKGVLSVLSVHPQAYFSEAPMPDDRIYCQQCRLLRPSGLCGSPAWGPRYHTPRPFYTDVVSSYRELVTRINERAGSDGRG